MVNLRETMLPASDQQNKFVVFDFSIEVIGSYILFSIPREIRKENENKAIII